MSAVNSTLVHDLLVELDRTGATPLHRQIEAALRDAIRAGRLRHGASLPASRRLATELGVSRGVVVNAYDQLLAEGYLTSTPGSYTRVAAVRGQAAELPTPPQAAGPRIDFGYGRIDPASFPRAAWLRSLRRVLTDAPHSRLNYPDGYGMPELRTALADYLNRGRSTSADPAQVLITSGYGQAVALITSVLAGRGARRVAVEDPSSDDVRLLAQAHGLDVVPLPVTGEGIEPAALERADADLVVLTPSHQWPLGGVLPAQARTEVVRWARGRGAVVVEDDYDAEAKLLADRGSPAIEQLAFADFLVRGELDRHLRRMRPVYRRRRDVLLARLAESLPGFEPTGVAAGLHVVVWLPDGVREADVVAAAAGHGVRVAGVGPYRLAGPGRQGLILGYGGLAEGRIVEGVAALAAAVRTLTARQRPLPVMG
ncbi:PLP-dependent aminotransferase family protein [Nonomuraea sp. NPDC049158]|uniref:aminotransferase-like domain-containing protein n=1 Tax=Nonomuraea sp. NPDC049158 TaxID=3155649 RepID=UPI0033F06EFC